MYLSKEAINFVKESVKYRNGRTWVMYYDEKYNIQFSFYFGEPAGGYNIISSLTLFEYGWRVVTFTSDALALICETKEVKEDSHEE
jgi:hypothetical protein